MKESTRRFYLSALGIDVWEARQVLPGAAPSPRASLETTARPVESAEQAFDAHAMAPDSQPETMPRDYSRMKSVLDDVPDASTETEAEDDVSNLPTEEQGRRLSARSLNCAFWHGRNLSMIADLDNDAGTGVQLRLGANIMRALGETDVEAEPFRWPPFENRSLPGNDDEALQRMIDYCASRSRSGRWVCLGPDAIKALTPVAEQDGHVIRLQTRLVLVQLAASSASKRQLWRMIQETPEIASAVSDDGQR